MVVSDGILDEFESFEKDEASNDSNGKWLKKMMFDCVINDSKKPVPVYFFQLADEIFQRSEIYLGGLLMRCAALSAALLK